MHCAYPESKKNEEPFLRRKNYIFHFQKTKKEYL